MAQPVGSIPIDEIKTWFAPKVKKLSMEDAMS
jgi:hypothetical protein